MKTMLKQMKTLLMLAMAVLFCVSCSSDDDAATAGDIAGVYNGYSLANCKYFTDKRTDGETLTVTKKTDNTATVTFSSAAWGNFTIDGAKMTESGGVYTLAGSGKTEMGMQGKVSEYDCEMTAVIKSTSDAQFSFSVPAVMGGLTLEFKTAE